MMSSSVNDECDEPACTSRARASDRSSCDLGALGAAGWCTGNAARCSDGREHGNARRGAVWSRLGWRAHCSAVADVRSRRSKLASRGEVAERMLRCRADSAAAVACRAAAVACRRRSLLGGGWRSASAARRRAGVDGGRLGRRRVRGGGGGPASGVGAAAGRGRLRSAVRRRRAADRRHGTVTVRSPGAVAAGVAARRVAGGGGPLRPVPRRPPQAAAARALARRGRRAGRGGVCAGAPAGDVPAVRLAPARVGPMTDVGRRAARRSECLPARLAGRSRPQPERDQRQFCRVRSKAWPPQGKLGGAPGACKLGGGHPSKQFRNLTKYVFEHT